MTRLPHPAPRNSRWLASALVLTLVALACGRGDFDIRQTLEITDITTGWLDAGIVEGGKNKLVPTISFRLRNVSQEPVETVQINGVFKRVQEDEEWGTAFVRVIGAEGLEPGSTTSPVVLQSQLGYTGEQPRAELLRHSEFMDARVELFVKHGSAQWVKLAERPIERQLLTQ